MTTSLPSSLTPQTSLLWTSPQWQRFHDLANKILESPSPPSEELWTTCLGDALDGVCRALVTDKKASSSPSTTATLLLRNLCTTAEGPPACVRLRSFAMIRKEVAQGSMSTLRAIDIQWQVRLRLALWQHLGNQAFTTALARRIVRDLTPKQRRRLKKEKMSPWYHCRQDITSLISLGILHTGVPARDFLVSSGLERRFLSPCAPGPPSWKTRLVREVWNFFDLLEPDTKPVPLYSKTPPASAVLPPLPEEASVQTQSTQASPLSTTTTATITSKENAQAHAYFGKRIKMTVPATKKTNTLLGKTARSRFVGSHFNTNLTNLPALFQSVSVPTMARKALVPQPQKKLPQKRRVVVAVSETPAAPRRKQSRVVWETPDDLRRPRVLRM